MLKPISSKNLSFFATLSDYIIDDFFQAIVGYVASEGYSLDKHEIVTNFPRRILTDLDTTQTLKDLGLFPKETVFVQQK